MNGYALHAKVVPDRFEAAQQAYTFNRSEKASQHYQVTAY